MLQIHAQIQDYAIDPLLRIVKKPLQVERKLVKFRKIINKVMQNPIRFQNVEIGPKTAEQPRKLINNEIVTELSTIKGNITTRIETYANKTRVLVFTNADDVYLKPYKKTIHL